MRAYNLRRNINKIMAMYNIKANDSIYRIFRSFYKFSLSNQNFCLWFRSYIKNAFVNLKNTYAEHCRDFSLMSSYFTVIITIEIRLTFICNFATCPKVNTCRYISNLFFSWIYTLQNNHPVETVTSIYARRSLDCYLVVMMNFIKLPEGS